MLHECKYVKKAPEDNLGVLLVAHPFTDILKMASAGVFESQLPNITKSKAEATSTTKSILKNPKQTDVNDACFELVGINEKSVRGLTPKQVEKLLSRIEGEVRILVRSPDDAVISMKCSEKLCLCQNSCCSCVCDDGCYC